MVTMTCCDVQYANVADTMDHKCSPKAVKGVKWVAAYVSGAVLAVGVVVGVVVGLVMVTNPAEDEALFNCHVNGNSQCGSEAVWHGFVNYRDALPF